MTAFLDTNVLIFLVNPKENHHRWATTELQKHKVSGPAIVTDIVYCEFSIGMKSLAHVNEVISQFGLQRLRASDAALFRAGRAYKAYKENRGTKTNVLPNFLIGAIAEEAGAPLLTANRRDFVTYFPRLQIISP